MIGRIGQTGLGSGLLLVFLALVACCRPPEGERVEKMAEAAPAAAGSASRASEPASAGTEAPAVAVPERISDEQAPVAPGAQQPTAAPSDLPAWVPSGCRFVRDVNRDGLPAALCLRGFEAAVARPEGQEPMAVVREMEAVLLIGSGPSWPDSLRATATGENRERLLFDYRGKARFCSSAKTICVRPGEKLEFPGSSEAPVESISVELVLASHPGVAYVVAVLAVLGDKTSVDLDRRQPSGGTPAQ